MVDTDSFRWTAEALALLEDAEAVSRDLERMATQAIVRGHRDAEDAEIELAHIRLRLVEIKVSKAQVLATLAQSAAVRETAHQSALAYRGLQAHRDY